MAIGDPFVHWVCTGRFKWRAGEVSETRITQRLRRVGILASGSASSAVHAARPVVRTNNWRRFHWGLKVSKLVYFQELFSIC